MPFRELAAPYLPELNPLHMRWHLLLAGLAAPRCTRACVLSVAPWPAVELSTLFHAAASPAEWYHLEVHAPDRSQEPNTAEHGKAKGPCATAGQTACQGLQTHATAEGLAVTEVRLDWDALRAGTAHLPPFDFIALPAVWSFLSASERGILTRFLHEKLALGGVVYLSCLARPGLTLMNPLLHLMRARLRSHDGKGARPDVAEALTFARQLMSLRPVYGLVNPQLPQKLAELEALPQAVLKRLLTCPHCEDFHFSRLCHELNEVKLSHATAAHAADMPEVPLPDEAQAAVLHDIQDPVLARGVRDFLANRGVQQDYWIKGALRLTSHQREQALRAQLCVLPLTARAEAQARTLLQSRFPACELHAPWLSVLADRQVHSVDELLRAGKTQGLTLHSLNAALLALTACGLLAPAQEATASTRARALSLNRALYAGPASTTASPLPCLFSPVTGGGVLVPPELRQAVHAALSPARDGQWEEPAAERGDLSTCTALGLLPHSAETQPRP